MIYKFSKNIGYKAILIVTGFREETSTDSDSDNLQVTLPETQAWRNIPGNTLTKWTVSLTQEENRRYETPAESH